MVNNFKIYISYFYQIRNFTPNMLPLSTAMYPPKWYRQMGINDYWVDKNGVINGLDISEFIFPHKIFNEHLGDAKCCNECGFYPISEDHYKWCPFMKVYYNHLKSQNLIDILNKYSNNIIRLFNHVFKKNIDTIVLIVHEPPEKYCGERPVLKKYFSDYGIELEEWRPNEK